MESRKVFGLSAICCLIITEFFLFGVYEELDDHYDRAERSGVLVAMVGCLAAGVLIWFATFYKARGRQLRAERAELEDMAKIKALREELGLPDKSDKGRS